MKHELSDIDPQKMDSQKWDLLLDLLEHPEKYSETQKDELLGDEEVNELYQQLVETRQSLDFAKSKEKMKMPSIDAEWEKLKEEMKNLEKKPNYMTVPVALKELEKIEMVRQLDNVYRLDHAVTANQKTILNAFGLDANHIKYYASELSKELKKAE